MSKICFLDIDGVLNSRQFFYRQEATGILLITKDTEMFDPLALKRLEKVLLATEAKIVVSSTWRSLGVKKLKTLFIECEFPVIADSIIDVTEQSREIRGKQIQKWLAGKDIFSYCILEDDPDTFMPLENLVQTRYETGMLDEHEKLAIKILNKE